MKKYLIIILMLITLTAIISCAPGKEKITTSPKNIPLSVPIQEETSQPPQIIASEPTPVEKTTLPILDKNSSKIDSSKIKREVTTSPSTKTSTSQVPSPTKTQATNPLIETFDGTTINPSKYNTKEIGGGTLTQNNELQMVGKSDYGIIWNAIYTKKKYNLMNDFNISAKVNLTGKTTIGNTIALVGVEDLSLITEGKNPERGYCEISTGSAGKLIRMSKSVGHLDEETPLSGILTFTYNTKLEKLTCTFNGKTITQYQNTYGGEYYATLRSGLNYASSGGIETEGIGSFSATFDNWYIKQE